METRKLKLCVQSHVKPEIGAVVMLLQETGKMYVAQFSSHINGMVSDNPDQYYWETLLIIDRHVPNRMYICREQRPYRETDTWVQFSVIFDSMRAASDLRTDAVIVETTEEAALNKKWNRLTLQKMAEYIENMLCPRMDAVEEEIRKLNEKSEQGRSEPVITPTPYPTPNTPCPWTPSPFVPYYSQPTICPEIFKVNCKVSNQ